MQFVSSFYYNLALLVYFDETTCEKLLFINYLIFLAAIPRPPPQMRTATRTPVVTPRVMPAKTKIMSILDRARIAMEESYGYEEPYEPTDPSYEYTPPAHARAAYSAHHYEPEYEPEYYREGSVAYGEYKITNLYFLLEDKSP